MKKIFHGLLIGMLAWVPLCAQEARSGHPVRTWMSVNGNTVDAAFLRQDGSRVLLQRPDGTTVATSRERLSPNDQAWIDQVISPTRAVNTRSFTQATQLEKNRMEEYRKVRRIILRTYTQLTNNEREDKALGFLQRDAFSKFGWRQVDATCYPTPSGQRGKIQEMSFHPQQPIELREAVQMARDKFVLVMPDPVVVEEVLDAGDLYWEVRNPPEYVSRLRLLMDPESGKVRRFDFLFPPPET